MSSAGLATVPFLKNDIALNVGMPLTFDCFDDRPDSAASCNRNTRSNEGMSNLCALDSGEEVFFSPTQSALVEPFLRLPEPLEYGGQIWDRWKMDQCGRVCLFRSQSDGLTGLRTDLLAPEHFGPFTEQLSDTDTCRKAARRSDFLYFKECQIPDWFKLGKRSLGFRNIPSFNPSVFKMAADDRELHEMLRAIRHDRISAIGRGHLCFVYDCGAQLWHIMKDSQVVRKSCSLSDVLDGGNEREFSSFLECIRCDDRCVDMRSR